jgi:predicted Zn-dependent peptidase
VGERVAQPIVLKRDIEQIYYRTGRYFDGLNDQERSALSMLRMLMVGGMGSRVLGEARRRGLAYSVGVASHTELGNASFGFTGYVTPAHAGALFEVANRGLQAIAHDEGMPAELEAAKDLLVGSVARSTQTAGDLLAWYLDRYDDEGEIRDFDAELQKLRAVTLPQVGSVARKVLAGSGGGMALLGKFDDAQAREFGEALRSIA